MTYFRAIQLAVECINKEIHRLAVDANLHEVYGAQYAAAKRSAKSRQTLRDAIAVLRYSLEDPMDI